MSTRSARLSTVGTAVAIFVALAVASLGIPAVLAARSAASDVALPLRPPGILAYDAISPYEWPTAQPAIIVRQPDAPDPFGTFADDNLTAMRSPRFSADGSRVAIVDRAPDHDLIVVRDPLTGEHVFSMAVDLSVGDLAWSPDSSELALTDGSTLYRLDLATHEMTMAYVARAPIGAIAWSPDGGQIALVVARSIVLVAPSGGRATLFTTSRGANTAPDWSPNGAEIAFLTTRFDPSGQAELVTLPRDGKGHVTRVSDTAGQPRSSDSLDDVAWSTDASRIAVLQTDHAGDRGAARIAWYAPDGSAKGWLTPVLALGDQVTSFDWAPRRVLTGAGTID